MIFFQIQAAHNIDYLRKLLSFIYRHENFYLVTIDRNHADAARDLAEQFAVFENIIVSYDTYITWGGVSQVNSMLAGMQHMLRLADRYRYYINLSDSDLPLWTATALSQFLRDAEPRRQFAFMSYWRPTLDFDDLRLTADIGITVFRHRPDVTLSVDNRVASYFREPGHSPIVAAARRPLFVCAEQAIVKTLHIRPLTPFEKTARIDFFRRNQLFIGRQWLILHISIISLMLSHARFNDFYQTFASTVIPDEMFFQTFLLNVVEDGNVISDDNLRFQGATPTRISDADLPELQASPAAFARKLDLSSADKLLVRARAMFAEEIALFDKMLGSSPTTASAWGARRPPAGVQETGTVAPNLKNVALGKPATQSSISAWSHGRTPEEDAAGGNNGEISGEAGFHTDREPNPWWQVDLQADHVVSTVAVYNRQHCAVRLRNFRVLGSLDGSEWQTLFTKTDGKVFGEQVIEPFVAKLKRPALARYVRIQIDDVECLHFSECQVLGFLPDDQLRQRFLEDAAKADVS